jgi:hypothetical protein
VHFAPEKHVLDDVEVVGEREVLVDDLDSELGGILRPVDRDRLAVEEDLTVVDRVDPGDAFDQRGLAGAVVADERHHLAFANLEVDRLQCLHGSEALGDPTEFEGRRGCRVHRGGFTTVGVLQASTPTVKVFYLQYFAYWPLQTWLLFRKPSAKRTL